MLRQVELLIWKVGWLLAAAWKFRSSRSSDDDVIIISSCLRSKKKKNSAYERILLLLLYIIYYYHDDNYVAKNNFNNNFIIHSIIIMRAVVCTAYDLLFTVESSWKGHLTVPPRVMRGEIFPVCWLLDKLKSWRKQIQLNLYYIELVFWSNECKKHCKQCD